MNILATNSNTVKLIKKVNVFYLNNIHKRDIKNKIIKYIICEIISKLCVKLVNIFGI